jgi:hypothetical protein
LRSARSAGVSFGRLLGSASIVTPYPHFAPATHRRDTAAMVEAAASARAP